MDEAQVRSIPEINAKHLDACLLYTSRYTLTIEEAARYYHIGEGKLRTLIDTHPNEDLYVMNGNRALIKREKFERYLDQATACLLYTSWKEIFKKYLNILDYQMKSTKSFGKHLKNSGILQSIILLLRQ